MPIPVPSLHPAWRNVAVSILTDYQALLKIAGQFEDATGSRLCHIQVARRIEGWVPGRVQAIHQDDPGAV